MNYKDYNRLIINGIPLKGREMVEYCGLRQAQPDVRQAQPDVRQAQPDVRQAQPDNRQPTIDSRQAQPGKQKEGENMKKLGEFLTDWLDDSSTISVQTSGSTGKPKVMKVEKNQMLHSAAMTAEFFGFEPGQSALLCLSMDYIAAKMMVVRALYSGLDLYPINPSKDPLTAIPEGVIIDFAPLVPMQLVTAQSEGRVKKILLGGAPVNPQLEAEIKHWKTEVYLSYGMTETLSHVAIRKLNGTAASLYFRSLPGVRCSADERGCLVLQVPFLKEKVVTNDVVELLDEKTFRWEGRIDHVINSGGVKLFPEKIEGQLTSLISQPFFVAGIPHPQLGEQLCLFIEGKPTGTFDKSALMDRFSRLLERYEKPKDLFFIDQFLRTSSGKIRRKATLDLFLKSL